jgi:cholesterol transport system auxiliary component
MKSLMKSLFMVMLVLGMAGCALGGKPTVMVEYYAVEYLPPPLQDLAHVDQVIGVERFSVAHMFNHAKMIYRQKPFQYNDYSYHRWRANPGDMIGDSLLRDLRAAGIFKSVFSSRDMTGAPFLLKGGVSEFYESEEADGRKAILSVNITLLDTTAREFTKRILFQKSYRYEEPVIEQSVQGFAGAMSRAARKLSGQVILDVHTAIKNKKA